MTVHHLAGRRSGSLPQAALVDAAVFTVLITAGALAFGPAYGGYRWLLAAAVGALIGGLIAALTAMARWHVIVTTLLAAVGYLVFGAALAAPTTAVGTVFPSVESIRVLGLGVVTSWRQMLTVATPVGSSGGLLIPVYLSALVLATFGVSVSARSRRPWMALIAPALMLLVAALFGTSIGYRPVLGGAVIAAVGLAWAAWRGNATDVPRLDFRRPVSALLILAVAVAAALYLGAGVTPRESRLALRNLVETTFDPQNYPSPLSAFRFYVKAAAETSMMTVTGLPAEGRIRLAALDDYDGNVYRLSTSTGNFSRVGDVVSDPGPGVPAEVEVSITGYSGLWLPTVGNLAGFSSPGPGGLTADLRYAKGSGTGAVINGLHSGDTYALDVRLPAVPTEAELRADAIDLSAAQLDTAVIPDALKGRAQEITKDATTPYDKAKAIQDWLVLQGVLSDGNSESSPVPSAAGHGAARLSLLVTDDVKAGDEEQFAPAMALMLQSLGIPARVVLGFRPDDSYSGTGSLDVKGKNISAWVEVKFAGFGWVTFDPTPAAGSDPPPPDPAVQSSPRQQVLQPPLPPLTPKEANPEDVEQGAAAERPKTEEEPPAPPATARGPWLAIGLGSGIAVLLVLVAVAVILLLKSRRRHRRQHAPDPADRIAGGWSQLLDSAVDLGQRTTLHLTRTEAAAALDAELGTGTLLLAQRADARVFGGEELDDAAAALFWRDVDAALLGVRSKYSALRRLRARLSLASLRRRS